MATKPTDLQKALAKKVIRRNTKPKTGNTAGADLHIQIGVNDGILRIEGDHLDRWLKARQQQKSPFIKALKKHIGLATVKASLFSGVPHIASGQTKLYHVDYHSIPELAGMMEDVATVGQPAGSNVVSIAGVK